jgi:hypothetical protein
MDNSTIEQINRIFKTKKLTWCGNFLMYDENASQECYDFTFQINEVKPMIYVGEWKDHALVDVTLYVDPNTILGKLVSGEYKEIWSESGNLLRFYPIKYGTADKITKALKLVSNLEVIVTSIKPKLIGNDNETITEQKINNNLIRNIVREISFEIKKDLHGKRKKNIGTYDIGMDEPVGVVLFVNPTPNKDENVKPLDIQGYWDEDENQIEIDVDIADDADMDVMYELIGELNDVVTHEFQHAKQTKRGYEFPDVEYKQPKRYYLQQHEIEAQVAGFKRKAKLQKRPIEVVIREYFEKRNIRKSLINLFVERLMDYYVNPSRF